MGYSSYRLYRLCCLNRSGYPFSSLTLDHDIMLKDYPHRGGGREGLSSMHIQFYFFKIFLHIKEKYALKIAGFSGSGKRNNISVSKENDCSVTHDDIIMMTKTFCDREIIPVER